jgi:uncharacterized Zn finger protein (UPF0148 family)
MLFVHCPDCAFPVREGRVFCTDCGAQMPDRVLVELYSRQPTDGVPRPRVRLRLPHLRRAN